MSEVIKISASKLKTFETCSWLYMSKYLLKLPSPGNDGSSRGTVAHLVLELLINSRHRRHYNAILEANNVEGSKAVFRLIQKAAKRERLDLLDNLEILNSIILVGLKYEFFGHSNLEFIGEVKVEGEFNIELSKEVLINGFIDKVVKFKDSSISIKDYKGSKKRFTGDELAYNVQALMYSLAIYKKTGIIPEVEFLFLRFPKKCSQITKKCTEEELLGFEEYLLHMAKEMKGFSLEKAMDNLAVNNDKNRWLCGRHDGWCCDYRKTKDFFSVKDAEGKQKKVYLRKEGIKLEPGQKIYKLSYKGCPAFQDESLPKEERKELPDF